MSIQHTLTLNWTRNSDSIQKSVSVSGENEVNFDVTVPGSGNVVIAGELDVSALTLVYISSDQTITLTTNDDGTPDDTFTITANKPLVWYSGCGLPNPFASGTDVESMKAARGSAGNASLKMRFIHGDVTT